MNRKFQITISGLLCFATLLAAKQMTAEWLARDSKGSSEVGSPEQSQSGMKQQALDQLDGLRRAATLERAGWLWSAVSSDHLATFAEAERFSTLVDSGQDTGLVRSVAGDSGNYLSRLSEALRFSPRSTGLRIRLGLAEEQNGDLEGAEATLLEASRLDRQYLPAWTLANYYFRRENDEEFWRWAKQASLRIYDDYRPLLRLADALESDPRGLLHRLHAGPPLTRAYLDYVIGKGRLEDADWVARYLMDGRKLSELESADRARIADLVDRHLDAQQIAAALDLWGLQGAALGTRDARLTNAAFEHGPSGTGFDWRVDACADARVDWQPGQLRVQVFQGAGASAGSLCSVLKQRVIVKAGKRYRLRVTAAESPDGQAAGAALSAFRWTLGSIESSQDSNTASIQNSSSAGSQLDRQKDLEQLWMFDRIGVLPGAERQANVAVWLVLTYRSPIAQTNLSPTIILRSLELEEQ